MTPLQRPAQAVHALARQLRQRGITSLYGNACNQLGVLSLPGVTVWTNGRILWWRTGEGTQITWPAADPEGAVRLLTTPTSGPGPPPPPEDARR